MSISTSPMVEVLEADLRLLRLENEYNKTTAAVYSSGAKLNAIYQSLLKQLLQIERDNQSCTAKEKRERGREQDKVSNGAQAAVLTSTSSSTSLSVHNEEAEKREEPTGKEEETTKDKRKHKRTKLNMPKTKKSIATTARTTQELTKNVVTLSSLQISNNGETEKPRSSSSDRGHEKQATRDATECISTPPKGARAPPESLATSTPFTNSPDTLHTLRAFTLSIPRLQAEEITAKGGTGYLSSDQAKSSPIIPSSSQNESSTDDGMSSEIPIQDSREIERAKKREQAKRRNRDKATNYDTSQKKTRKKEEEEEEVEEEEEDNTVSIVGHRRRKVTARIIHSSDEEEEEEREEVGSEEKTIQSDLTASRIIMPRRRKSTRNKALVSTGEEEEEGGSEEKGIQSDLTASRILMPRRRKSARNKVLVSTDEEEKSEEEEETVNLKSNTKKYKKKVPVSDSEESEEWLPTIDVEVDNESDSESNVGEEEDSESVVPETPQKRSTRQNKEKLFQLSSVTTHTDSTDKQNNQPTPLTLRSPPTRHSLEHHTLSPQRNTRKPSNKTKTQENKQQDSPPTPRGEEAVGTDTNTMTVITRSRREVLQVTDNLTSSNTTTTASTDNTERTSRTSAITNCPLSASVTDDAAGVTGDVNRPRDPPPPSRHPRTHKSGRTLPKPPAVNQSGLSILDLTSSRLSTIGLKRRTLLNSRFTAPILDDTQDEAHINSSRASIRLNSTNFIAPKLKLAKKDKAV